MGVDPPPRPVASGARLSPPKMFTHFALLDHEMGNTDPGFWTKDGASFDPGRQRLLERMLADIEPTYPSWKSMRLAMVDLSGGAPELCGVQVPGSASTKKKGETITDAPRCMETWEAASCTKVALLYAAFQLRKDLVAMADANPGATPDELRDKMRIKWLASQVIDTTKPTEVLRAKGPKVELRGTEVRRDGNRIPLVQDDGTAVGPPKLDQIFDITKVGGKWSIRFQGEVENWDTDFTALNRMLMETDDVKKFSQPLPKVTASSKRPFKFFELLWLTVELSHDEASDKCIDMLGFLYINSVLWRSGLFDPRRGGGMWVGRHYLSPRFWAAPPCPEVKTRDGMVVRAGTSAVAGCAFMTLLHQGKLVDKATSQQMAIFVSRTPPFASKLDTSMHQSWFVDGLQRSGTKVVQSFNKIGLGSFYNLFDIALVVVEDEPSKRTYRYAVCVLDGVLMDSYADPGYDVINPPIRSVTGAGGPTLGSPAPMPPIPPPPPAPRR
jgi:hypothetical protein